MDHDQLRSGDSLWRATGEAPVDCPRLEDDSRGEVVVIGAGITGVLIAYMLSKAGVDTILVDREPVGTGSTAASTGLLQYEVDTPLVELIAKVGESKAVHAYRRGLQAVDELESLTAQIGTDCGFARRSTLYLASREEDLPDLLREYEARRYFGFDVSYWERGLLREQFGIGAPGAMYSQGDAEVNPYELTQGILRAALANGVRAFQGVDVETVREHSRGVTVSSESGRIEAGSVIVATGYSAGPFLPGSFVDLQTTYALASEPLPALPQWPDKCLLWETARPYFYARQTPDGRVVIGGEDTPYADDHQTPELLAQKAERLRLRFEALFPGVPLRPAYTWAGTFAETKDGLPFIGRRAGSERVYFALGYGGNGITYSMIAGGLLRDLILGRPNPAAAVFGFDR